MFSCNCCNLPKIYSSHKALQKHRKKYDTHFSAPSKTPIKDAYEENPTICLTCNNKVSHKTWRGSKGKAKFCSKSCAATHNNKLRKSQSRSYSNEARCLRCDELFLGNKGRKFCSMTCSGAYRSETYDGPMTAVRRKKQLVSELGHQCQCCKLTEWNGIPITLEIEHIDGNSDDHSRENTTLLCPNCHSQTPTYKNRNRGRGRAARRKRYAEGKSY